MKNLFLTDSVQKQMLIEVDDEPGNLVGINWYIGNLDETRNIRDAIYVLTAWTDELNSNYFKYAEYLYVSCNIKITSYTKLPNTIRLYVFRGEGYGYELSLSDDWVRNGLLAEESAGLRLFLRVPREEISKWNAKNYSGETPMVYMTFGGDINYTYHVSNVKVEIGYEELLLEDLYPYAKRYDYANKERYGLKYNGIDPASTNKTISGNVYLPGKHIEPLTNEDLDLEASSLTESLSSADNLKLGACEAAHYEIKTIGRRDNFKDRLIRPYISIGDKPYKKFNISNINWFKGENTNLKVDEASDVPWYGGQITNNKVMSLGNINKKYLFSQKYFALKYKMKIKSLTTDFDVRYVRCGISPVYGNKYIYNMDKTVSISDIRNNYIDITVILPSVTYEDFNDIRIAFILLDKDKNTFKEQGTVSIFAYFKDIQLISIVEKDEKYIPAFSTDDCLEWRGINVDAYIEECKRTDEETLVPYGAFRVKEINRENMYNTVTLSLTALDALADLNINAANWYKIYMYGMNLHTLVSGTLYSNPSWDYWENNNKGYEYARQFYSTYWNLISAIRLDSREKHTECIIYSSTSAESVEKYIDIPIDNSYWFFKWLQMGKLTIDLSDKPELVKHPFVVDIEYEYRLNSKFGAVQGYFTIYSAYRKYVDYYGRGILNKADVMICEHLEDGSENKFLCDNGDYFMLSENCVSFDIYYPHTQMPHAPAGVYCVLHRNDESRPTLKVSYAEDITPDLINGSSRLMYYNYNDRTIFDCDSSLTANDVVRSILEMNGCFLNSDRRGDLVFKYCSKEALYPRNDLYPRDNLYPRGSSVSINRALYTKTDFSDFSVQNYGGVQILINSRSNSADSSCSYKYIADSSNINTYIIDTNIFYSSNNMVYEKNMPDVEKVLKLMYSKIKNMSYTPNTTEAIGLPWVEIGDRVNVLTMTGGFESFLFRRTLKGIHSLKDTYESTGDEYTLVIDEGEQEQYDSIAPY